MRIAFLATTVHDIGGTANAVVTQGNALARHGHDVQLISVYRTRDDTHFPIERGVTVHDLVDLRDDAVRTPGISADLAARLRGVGPLLNQPSDDPTVDALADVGLERFLPTLDADVLVTVSPALMSYAVQLAPARTAVVHQEHRASSQRQSSLGLLLHAARRADVVAMLTEPMAAWMAAELGAEAPEIVVVPNAIPPGYRPRSTLTEPVIISAGRFAAEKQWPHLIGAFGRIADQIPDWRVRIFGNGPAQFEARAMSRKLGLWDRVELPGPTQDITSEWARASMMALTSRPGEGFPLVIQEAMAAGVPVVAYDMPTGPRDQIEHDVDGLLVTQGSQAGLAAALLRLATSLEERQRLGAAAVVKAATWDSDVITRRWIEIYETAARRRAGATGRAAQALTLHVTQPPPVVRPPDEAPDGVGGESLTPEGARRAGFAAVVAHAARTASRVDAGRWFVVPPHGAAAPAVVLPMACRTAFVEGLADAGLPPWLSVHDPDHRGWPSRRGTPAEMTPPLLRGRTARLLLEPWPRVDGAASLIAGAGTVVEFWEVGPTGELVTPDPPAYAATVPPDVELIEAEVLGVTVPTVPVMLEATVDDCAFPIDVVYTWVDGSDDAWNARREARLSATTDTAMRDRTASGRARYADRGELRYSMRGLHLFAPWVRTIHLVTDQQVPDWLDVDHPRINLVDHRDLLPADALPTFNSHAIEAALHRIPGLSEQFVYFNDDVFLGRPVAPELFFSGAGLPAAFVSSTVIGLPGHAVLPWQTAAENNRRLLREAFGRTTLNTMLHTPHPQRVSTLREIEARFPDAVATTERAPFRSPADVSMLSNLAQHYGLMTGAAYRGEIEFTFVDITDPHVARRLRELETRERDGFCIADGHDFARDPAVVAQLVVDFLQRYFPIAAPWER